MSDNDINAIAKEIRSNILASPKKSRRILLKSLLRQFGYKARQKQAMVAIQQSLENAGIYLDRKLGDADRSDWITLSALQPNIPLVDQTSPPEEPSLTVEADTWLETIGNKTFSSEKEVEIRFILPLLDRLGYGDDDRSDGYAVEQVVGVRRSRTEADFVMFDGINRGKDNALLVVEAKGPGKKLADYIPQARSYAMFLGTPYFMVTDGDNIRVYLYRSPIESDIEVFKATRAELPKILPELTRIIGKAAVVDYKKRRATALVGLDGVRH